MTGRIFGKYQIEAELGKGVHGTVYRATHVEQQRAYALKLIDAAALEQRAIEPFRAYSGGLARVRHPGIARFVEMVSEGPEVGLVFELAEGSPLSALLKEGAFPEPKKAWDILRQMLEALAYAHQQGAVHRNIKPGNVILNADGSVVICDLGVSILYVAKEETAIEYYSPEHIRRGKITARSDLYQVGALAYQLVTGKLPFTGDGEELRRAILEDTILDPSSHNKGLAWQLDWVIQKAVAKQPEARYNAAIEMAEGMRLGLQDTVGRPLDIPKPPPVTTAPIAIAEASVPEPSVSAPEPAPTAAAKPVVPAPAAAAKPAPPPPAPPPAAPAAAKPQAPPPAPPAAEKPASPPAAAPKPAAQPSLLMQNAKVLAAKAAAPAPEKPTPAGSGKPNVLFVDDDPRILNALAALFRQEYNVQIAEGGAAALEIMARGPIQVIVSDQRMPGVTGVELLQQVRKLSPSTVRMLLTGYTDLASLVGSINHGEIFRFVMKPWENDELRVALAEAVRTARELAATAPAAVSAPRSAGSLLVIDPQEGVARGLERLLAGSARVILVGTVADAAKVMAKEEIAAIVADIGTGMDGLVALFRQIRAKRPGVLSILLTDEPDAELAIELVNRAHVFRLLPKPVSARDLRTQVAEALRRYSVYKQTAAATPQAGSAVGDRPGALPARALASAT